MTPARRSRDADTLMLACLVIIAILLACIATVGGAR